MQGSSKTTKATSCALAGKTARACESCLKKRARWYCASDDAFLCHACDTSVHVVNKLASRHKRVCLEIQNPRSVANPNFHSASSSLSPSTLPAWQGGFTRKARTPRNGSRPTSKKSSNNLKNNLVVPEIGSDNEWDEDLCGSLKIKEDDQLIFSVPIFDPFEISSGPDHQNEFCENSKLFGGGLRSDRLDFESGFGISLVGFDDGCDQLGRDVVDDDDDENNWNKLRGFLPSDAELAEFAADVETLLIDDDEEGRMKGIMPLLDDDDHKVEIESVYGESYGIKVEDDTTLGESVNMAAVSSCWGLDFSMKCEDEKVVVVEEEKPVRWAEGGGCGGGGGKGSEISNKRKICLRLNYDEVINEWANQGSPWTSGCRPEFDVIDGWPNCMGGVGPTGVQSQNGEGGHVGGGDGGRGARVMRYREKRKSRLFSKKIRYEVRKLNAEKRPRLKGRFVKRTNSSSYTSSSIGVKPTFPYLKV